ncbi:hypothetical protein J2W51_005884 [Tardiphaga robiniae]|nr:hypothetical protein [Tardiphaga robiniae]
MGVHELKQALMTEHAGATGLIVSVAVTRTSP